MSNITLDEARAIRAATIPAGRYGTIEEFGATCAFLCSQHAGFIVGRIDPATGLLALAKGTPIPHLRGTLPERAPAADVHRTTGGTGEEFDF